jgi:hypothetical protein
MQAATHITISLTSAYRYSNLSASRLFHQKPFGYSPQKGWLAETPKALILGLFWGILAIILRHRE